jgi:glycosyltransferase involved in cell wall biosynthesis
MKILYHHRTASKDGQAVHIEEMIGALRELGHEVRVVGPVAPAEGDMGNDAGWVHRLRQRLPRAAYELLELSYSLVAYLKLRKAAAEFHPDVIYERCNLYLLAGLWLKRRLRVPLLLEVNSPLADERERYGGLALPRLARWSERAVWRGADKVLAVTGVLGAIVRAQGVAGARIAVIPNGINEAHFAAAPSPHEAKAQLGWSDSLVLGFTGFVRDWHGVDRVLHWMASPAAPAQARLLVVGDGPVRPALEALAAELGLAGRVRFTGFIAREAVPARVAAFDIALQPAVTPYASPLKLFEYLVLGKPVLAPRTPNLLEILRDDSNALLFDEQVPGSFEAALTRLAADAALRQRLAVGARNTITEMGLTWHGNAQRVVHMAAELLQSRGDGAAAAVAPSARPR